MESGYLKGYTQGIADGLSKVNIQYTYHVHEGSAGTTANGCYTTPIYHSHNSSCSSYLQYRGTRKWSRFMDGDTAWKWVCDYCGKTGYAPEGGGTEPCSSCAVRVYTCGKTGTIASYALGCGKNEQTIESATIIY